MFFNVGKVDFYLFKKKLTFGVSSLEKLDFIVEYEIIRGFLSLKIQKHVNESQNGVEILNGDPIQVDEFIKNYGGSRVFTISYAFINLESGKFYYSCTLKTLYELMFNLFQLHKTNLNFSASYEDLKKINQIRVIKTNEIDIISFPVNSSDETLKDELLDVMDESEEPSREEIILQYASGVFNLNKLKKLVEKYQNSSNIKLSVKGTDEKGNTINLNESILKRIEVDTINNFNDFLTRSLSEILTEIELKE